MNSASASTGTAPAGIGTVQKRWGQAVSGGRRGYQPVPDVLLRGQHRLGLSNTELAVILNITLHWWYSDKWPYPRPSVIAKRMGTNVRTVERAIKSLEKKKLIRRLPAERNEQNLLVRPFDLTGLVSAVNALARGRIEDAP